MTVKCVEMLKQLCSKRRDKNGGSDLSEGIILLINSIESMQAVMQERNHVKQMVRCPLEHFNLTEYVPAMLVPSVQEEPAMLW